LKQQQTSFRLDFCDFSALASQLLMA